MADPAPSRSINELKWSSAAESRHRKKQATQSSRTGHETGRAASGSSNPRALKPSQQQQMQRQTQQQQGQYFLDFGQKDFTLRECKECGLVYAPGMPQDETLHREHHARSCSDADRPLNPKRRRVLSGTDAPSLAPGLNKGPLSPRLSAPSPALPLRMVWQEEAVRPSSAGTLRSPKARSPSPLDRDCICLVLPSDSLALRTKVAEAMMMAEEHGILPPIRDFPDPHKPSQGSNQGAGGFVQETANAGASSAESRAPQVTSPVVFAPAEATPPGSCDSVSHVPLTRQPSQVSQPPQTLQTVKHNESPAAEPQTPSCPRGPMAMGASPEAATPTEPTLEAAQGTLRRSQHVAEQPMSPGPAMAAAGEGRMRAEGTRVIPRVQLADPLQDVGPAHWKAYMYISRGGVLGIALAEALQKPSKGPSSRPEIDKQGPGPGLAERSSPAPVPLTTQYTPASILSSNSAPQPQTSGAGSSAPPGVPSGSPGVRSSAPQGMPSGASGPTEPSPQPGQRLGSPEAPARATPSSGGMQANNNHPPPVQHLSGSTANAQIRSGKTESIAGGVTRGAGVGAEVGAEVCRVSVMCIEKEPATSAEFRHCMSTRLQEAARRTFCYGCHLRQDEVQVLELYQ